MILALLAHRTFDASTDTPLPDACTIAVMTNDSIIESTEDGSAGPTDLLTPAEIATGVIGLVISTIGTIIAAYMCFQKYTYCSVMDWCMMFVHISCVSLLYGWLCHLGHVFVLNVLMMSLVRLIFIVPLET